MYGAALDADHNLKPEDVSVTTWMGYDRPMDLAHADFPDPARASAAEPRCFRSRAARLPRRSTINRHRHRAQLRVHHGGRSRLRTGTSSMPTTSSPSAAPACWSTTPVISASIPAATSMPCALKTTSSAQPVEPPNGPLDQNQTTRVRCHPSPRLTQDQLGLSVFPASTRTAATGARRIPRWPTWARSSRASHHHSWSDNDDTRRPTRARIVVAPC